MDTCFGCEAPIVPGQKECLACGLPLTPVVFELAQRAARAERTHGNRRMLIVTIAIVSFIAGVGLTTCADSITAPASHATSALPDSTTRGALNDLFVTQVNKLLPIHIRAWRDDPELGLVFEMEPPTSTSPVPYWETLSVSDRQTVVGGIAARYGIMLMRADLLPDPRLHGHPVVSVAYLGAGTPVGIAKRDGSVQIFQSPFAQAVAQPVPVAPAPQAPQPAAATTP